MISPVKVSFKLFIFLFVLNASLFADVMLPKIISDGIVLQRNAEVKIWGWADPEENITLHFMDSLYQTSADDSGNWAIKLSDLEAGGPYTMTIAGKDTIELKNILVGDVWVCSGQSNMELTMQRVSPLYKDEIANANNPRIHYFDVPKTYNFDGPQKDFPYGKWVPVNRENILSFSAVAYFFGKEIYKDQKVPIGLVLSALGGSPAEAWMSEDALKEFPSYYKEARRFRDSTLIKEIQISDRARISKWYTELHHKDAGYKGKPWYSPDLNTRDWQVTQIPGYWDEDGPGIMNGVVWFRRTFNIPDSLAGKQAKLLMGRIVDADSVFVNGKFVGTTGYQYPPRRYSIPQNLLKKGENVIAARVISNIGVGGFVPDKPYEIIIDDQKIDLKGKWRFKIGAKMKPLESQTFIRWKPEGLYNAMLAPLLNYHIKGVIWYQGESNAERPIEYRKLFPAMIRDWRKNWGQGNFPFIFAQLPNCMEARPQPSESNWALWREAQLRALSLPNTGMAVTIDLGEWNDIHPLDKEDVGKRLALAAKKVAYGEDIVYSGPIYKSMEIKGNKIILSFDHTGSGLEAKGSDKLQCFAIAGKDKKFVWAKAKIEDNRVVVWNEHIENPAAVRYAWADNPENANLYNKEGLPASPFRTDNW
ncbi:MAG: sialate O-acetylesterase [Calditrichaceae bacterium]